MPACCGSGNPAGPAVCTGSRPAVTRARGTLGDSCLPANPSGGAGALLPDLTALPGRRGLGSRRSCAFGRPGLLRGPGLLGFPRLFVPRQDQLPRVGVRRRQPRVDLAHRLPRPAHNPNYHRCPPNWSLLSARALWACTLAGPWLFQGEEARRPLRAPRLPVPHGRPHLSRTVSAQVGGRGWIEKPFRLVLFGPGVRGRGLLLRMGPDIDRTYVLVGVLSRVLGSNSRGERCAGMQRLVGWGGHPCCDVDGHPEAH